MIMSEFTIEEVLHSKSFYLRFLQRYHWEFANPLFDSLYEMQLFRVEFSRWSIRDLLIGTSSDVDMRLRRLRFMLCMTNHQIESYSKQIEALGILLATLSRDDFFSPYAQASIRRDIFPRRVGELLQSLLASRVEARSLPGDERLVALRAYLHNMLTGESEAKTDRAHLLRLLRGYRDLPEM